MELKINIVEAAAELAERQLKRLYATDHNMKWDNPAEAGTLYNMVYDEDSETNTIVFTEEAQDIFNAMYDEIFEKLMDCRVGDLPVYPDNKII
jgi:hypothetical protein